MTAILLLFLCTLEALLFEEIGLLLTLLLHPEDMERKTIITVTIILGKANEAFDGGLGGWRLGMAGRIGVAEGGGCGGVGIPLWGVCWERWSILGGSVRYGRWKRGISRRFLGREEVKVGVDQDIEIFGILEGGDGVGGGNRTRLKELIIDDKNLMAVLETGTVDPATDPRAGVEYLCCRWWVCAVRKRRGGWGKKGGFLFLGKGTE
jgi:hypothetical protein